MSMALEDRLEASPPAQPPLHGNDAHDLVARLPLPAVILRRDGRLVFSNAVAARAVAPAWLTAVAPTLLDLAAQGEPLPLVMSERSGGARPVTAHAAALGDEVIAVFDDPDRRQSALELAGLKRRIIELERTSATDRLTGLWNRAHFDRLIVREAHFSEAQLSPLSLVLLDLDRFKQVNDRHGHAAGDAVLRHVATALKAGSRPTDLLFRWGGEEFALLAPATSAPAAAAVAERLRARVAADAMPLVGRMTVSAGVGEHGVGEGLDHWFERVDAALYRAKAEGRNRVMLAPGGASELWLSQRSASALRLVWSEELVSGNPLIDEQHRALFDGANALMSMMSEEALEVPALLDRLDCLIAAIGRHFADEEAALAAVRYPELETHRRMHQRLLEGARRLRGRVESHPRSPGEVIEFLAFEVVNRHILKADRHFFPFVAAAAGQEPRAA